MVRTIQQARDLLGVAPDSDPATVAHAYRRLARANHPDVSAAPDAAQRFTTIAAAYRLLRQHATPTTQHPGPQVPIHAVSFDDGPRQSAIEPVRAWQSGSVGRSPLVAGPVTVTPPRRGSNAGSSSQEDF